MQVLVHRTAEISPAAVIGDRTRVWSQAQVREDARIGGDCILGKGVYVDRGVVIGNRVKLENGVSVFEGARIEDGVFIGPHTCLLNDKRPRSVTLDGDLKQGGDWTVAGVTVLTGASVGGGCTVLPGVTIGRLAMVGAGAVVTRDVPDHALVYGNPARAVGFVCECGARLGSDGRCVDCDRPHPAPVYSLLV